MALSCVVTRARPVTVAGPLNHVLVVCVRIEVLEHITEQDV